MNRLIADLRRKAHERADIYGLWARMRSMTSLTLRRCEMANIKQIRSEADYDAALTRIFELMDAEPGSQEGDELDVLAELVELYESKHVPMG